ncbi:MAG: ABC transporter permease [Candidatus Omnitrophica bacterium]|nr:ABC transporter permease [Candidatus Omnitrophota bacterium]
MNWKLFISWRYFMAKRKQRFISFISLISILGIALGVMTLMAVISVMNGFGQELREKLVGVNPHIIIEQHEGIENSAQLLAQLDNTKHVLGASGHIRGKVLLKANDGGTGVIFRGIDPARETKVTQIEKYLVAGTLDLTDTDIIIGSELARSFYLGLGDKVTVISPHKGKNFNFQVAGIFTSGFYEYDANLVLTNIPAAQKVFNLKGRVGGIGVRLDNLYRAPIVRQALQKKLGHSFWVRDWIQMNSNLFSAIKLEKMIQFVIAALIVVVACFSIVGTLIMMVMEKTKDIGILKAIGATNREVRKIFTLVGVVIGVLGTAVGAAGGVLLCHLLKNKIFSLPQDVYYIAIEGLPIQMRWLDSAIIIVGALIVSLLATIYPAHQAAKLNPADTLRYQ